MFYLALPHVRTCHFSGCNLISKNLEQLCHLMILPIPAWPVMATVVIAYCSAQLPLCLGVGSHWIPLSILSHDQWREKNKSLWVHAGWFLTTHWRTDFQPNGIMPQDRAVLRAKAIDQLMNNSTTTRYTHQASGSCPSLLAQFMPHSWQSIKRNVLQPLIISNDSHVI